MALPKTPFPQGRSQRPDGPVEPQPPLVGHTAEGARPLPPGAESVRGQHPADTNDHPQHPLQHGGRVLLRLGTRTVRAQPDHGRIGLFGGVASPSGTTSTVPASTPAEEESSSSPPPPPPSPSPSRAPTSAVGRAGGGRPVKRQVAGTVVCNSSGEDRGVVGDGMNQSSGLYLRAQYCSTFPLLRIGEYVAHKARFRYPYVTSP